MMTERATATNPHELKRIFEGAEVIKVDEQLETVAVWSGGTGINLYDARNLQEQTVYNLSDENGEYVDPEEAEAHIEELFETEREKRFEQ